MNARLKGRDNIYKNDPWLLSVYVAHLSLTAHQLIFIFSDPQSFSAYFSPVSSEKGGGDTGKNFFRKLPFL